MKVRFNKATWKTAGIICASCILVVSFQNCGKAGFDASLDDSLDSASLDAALTSKYGSSTAAKVTNIPFAFDAGFDQIAYNSCDNGATLAPSDAYYAIKAGAYQTSGLSLKPNFFTYADAEFKPIYPATSLSKAQYEEFLADSPANINAQPIFAIRDRSNLRSVYRAGTSLVTGSDISPLLDNLTSAYIMETLMSERGSTSRFFPFSSGAKTLEVKLKNNSDPIFANSMRVALSNAAQLTLAYNNDSTDITSVLPSSDAKTVKTAYGKGYRFTFSQPVGVSNNYVPQNIVSAIQEVDLSTGSIVKNWSCGRVYKIVLARDAATYCPPHTAADLDNASVRSEIEIFRRQFRADQWDVNVLLKCMVPKGTTPSGYDEKVLSAPAVSCSGQTLAAGAQGVEYDTTKECNSPYLEQLHGGASSVADYPSGCIPQKRCMNYATICTRP